MNSISRLIVYVNNYLHFNIKLLNFNFLSSFSHTIKKSNTSEAECLILKISYKNITFFSNPNCAKLQEADLQ